MDSPPPAPVCSQCGQPLQTSESIQFGGGWICSSCKPLLEQKLREGESTEPGLALHYAGFWIRGGAALIDGLIHFSFGTMMGLLCGQSLAEATGFGGGDEFTLLEAALLAVSIAADIVYSTVLVGRYGGTVGKLMLGLRVVRADGSRMTFPGALGRCLAIYVSMLPCLGGFIIAAFDSEKRALHDHICGTRVVHVRRRKVAGV